MPTPQIALLPERGILQISGDDAQSFLQGLITNDIDILEPGQALFAGLLSPQGKLLFDFFVIRTSQGYLIDVAQAQTADLAKRLGFYRLRAKVDIEDLSEEKIAGAIWDGLRVLDDVLLYDDPRLDALGQRFISDPQQFETSADEADYRAHRISKGVCEGGEDFDFGTTFPHETNMDVLHGIAFEKGCYVGQEVVSRMQHRGTTRKRIIPIIASMQDENVALPERGSEVRAGPALIGTLGSNAGQQGMAFIRLDRAAEALEKGQPLLAGDTRLDLVQPDWAPFKVPVSPS